MKNFISKLGMFFKVGTIESMTRLMSFSVIISASISLLIFIIVLSIRLYNDGTKELDLYGCSALIASLATVLTVGFGGKYYGAKLENKDTKDDTTLN